MNRPHWEDTVHGALCTYAVAVLSCIGAVLCCYVLTQARWGGE